MALTTGVISLVSVQSNTAQLVTTPASAGVSPYFQQWYRSTTTGFTPGGGNILAGQTALNLNDSGLIPNTVYYYQVIYSDSTSPTPQTVTSAQFTLTTAAASQSINQFQQAPFLGQLDLKVGGTNVVAGQVDVSQSFPIYGGTAVKIVDNGSNIPKVAACSADTDNVFGFIAYDVKSPGYVAGARVEIAIQQACVWLYATTAITRGTQVVLDVTSQGAVQAASSGDTVVGFAYDGAAAYGSLIRVYLSTPSFTQFT